MNPMKAVKLLAATGAIATVAIVAIDFIDPRELKKNIVAWFDLGE